MTYTQVVNAGRTPEAYAQYILSNFGRILRIGGTADEHARLRRVIDEVSRMTGVASHVVYGHFYALANSENNSKI